MDTKEEGFSTRVINAEFTKQDAHGAISMPVYRNAAFEFASSQEIADTFQYKTQGHTYTRISNPTVENFEQKIRQASGANQVMALASGMAAISNTLITIAYAGSNIVTSPHLFGNTFSLLQSTLADFGVETRFVDTDNLQQIEQAIDENTCAFFCELITNPHMEVADLPQISKLLKAHRIPLIVDTTIVSWCAFDARQCGIDIEVVSTTKYISGGATSIGGVVLDYQTFDWSKSANKKLATLEPSNGMSAFMHKLKREIARNMGATMDPDTASFQSLGMETLELRYKQVTQSAYDLALFLEAIEKVEKVGYTKLASSAYKHISDQLFSMNPGAMLTFNLSTKQACFKFMDQLKIIRRATNLFDNKTLIIHPESTIYGTFSEQMKITMGIEDNLLRLSVGLENVQDLKKDIQQALELI